MFLGVTGVFLLMICGTIAVVCLMVPVWRGAAGTFGWTALGGVALFFMGMFIDVISDGPPTSAAVANSGTAAAGHSQLRLGNWHCSSEYGFQKVEGEVTNQSSRPIERLMAQASFYDGGDGFVKSAESMVEYQPLLPGQTSPFRVMTTHNPAIDSCRLVFKTMFGGTISTD